MNTQRLSAVARANYMLLIAIVIIVALLTLAIMMFESRVHKSVLADTESQLKVSTQQMRDLIYHTITDSQAELRFLHATPPISGLPRAHFNGGIDPFDDTRYEQWKLRLETIFIAFMQNKADIEQLRVVSTLADDPGAELIRVERRGGLIEALPAYSLQNKLDSDYYSPSAELIANQVYMSRLNLNRENGEIEFPYRPVLRYAIAIFAPDGRRFGFLIMNVNANPLLTDLAALSQQYGELVISSSQGDVIYHPDEAYRFTRDIDPSITWDSLYDSRIINNEMSEIKSKLDGESWYVFSGKVNTRNSELYNYVNLSTLVPTSYISASINDKRLMVYSFLVVALAVFAIVIFSFHRSALRSQLLAEARRQSSAIVDGSIDAIVALDMNGYLTTMNHAAEVLLKTTINHVKGMHFEYINLLQELPVNTYLQALTKSAKRVNDEWHDQDEDQECYLAIAVSPVRAQQNQLEGIALIIRDITKERKADSKVRKLNEELDQKVKARTKELASAKDDAQKASDVKSAFISNISHEMRTPLNGIIGTLGLIKREQHSEKSARLLEMMELSASNLNVLINDILDLSKIEAGKLEINPKPFNPVALLESVVMSAAVKAFNKDLEVLIDTSALQCQEVITDPHRFTQIINNLLSNAIKFTERGYIKITAKGEVVNSSQYTLSVTVKDTGIGIAESMQAKLFSAFTQADSGIAAKYGGTGLGLSICRQLSQLLNGDVELTSVPEQGSEFTCYITLALDSVRLKRHAAQLNDINALVLMDDKALAEHVVETLTFDGATAHISELKYLNSQDTAQYDAVVINSKEASIECLEALKNDYPKRIMAPVIALQSSSCPAISSQTLKVIKVNKPLLLSELRKAILDPERVQHNEDNSDFGKLITPPETLAKLAGRTVLVVDDNDINIEVAVGMLSSLPLDFVRANNGQQAIDVLCDLSSKGVAVSCILMDCQMPILNGYDATMKIRAGAAGKQNSHVPIVAMTANALLGEKEKCLAAGMNDYVSKPLVVEEAEVKVVRWILSYSGSEEELTTSAKTMDANDHAPLWDREAALTRLLNKEDLLNRICAMFVKTAPAKMASLEQAVAQRDAESIRQVAHSFKGLCGEICATKLHGLLNDIEHSAGAGNVDVQSQLDVLKEQVPELLAQLQSSVAVS